MLQRQQALSLTALYLPLLPQQASWEAEEHLPSDLIKLFQQENPQLFEQRVAAAASGEAAPDAWPLSAELEWGEAVALGAGAAEEGYRTQYAPVRVAV